MNVASGNDRKKAPGDLAGRIKSQAEHATGPRHAGAGSPRQPYDHGHYDIRIARDGTWYYRGSIIARKQLVRLFASVLFRDKDGEYWLRTPVEMGRIDVDDAPFTAVGVERLAGPPEVLQFRTNLDEIVVAGPDYPLRVETDSKTGQPSPYIMVRAGLEALLTRPVYYELVDLSVPGPEQRTDELGVLERRPVLQPGDGLNGGG